MKMISTKPARNQGFNLMELAVVLAVVTFLGVIIFSVSPKAKSKAKLIKCASNLKSLAFCFKIFAGDSGGYFPFSATNSPAYQDSTNAWTHFQTMSNELGSAKILLCPADIAHRNSGAATFTAQPDGLATLQNKALSFFINVDGNETNALNVLIGDRNLLVGNKPVTSNTQLSLPGTAMVQWGADIHGSIGNVALCDGSVQSGVASALVWMNHTNQSRLAIP